MPLAQAFLFHAQVSASTMLSDELTAAMPLPQADLDALKALRRHQTQRDRRARWLFEAPHAARNGCATTPDCPRTRGRARARRGSSSRMGGIPLARDHAARCAGTHAHLRGRPPRGAEVGARAGARGTSGRARWPSTLPLSSGMMGARANPTARGTSIRARDPTSKTFVNGRSETTASVPCEEISRTCCYFDLDLKETRDTMSLPSGRARWSSRSCPRC